MLSKDKDYNDEIEATLTSLSKDKDFIKDQSNDLLLNTPAYVPSTPKWCPDDRICPPGQCTGSIGKNKTNTIPGNNAELVKLTASDVSNELTSISMLSVLDPAVPQSTPFQTPPPSVTYSSSHTPQTATPEHFDLAMTSPESEETPISPPDLFIGVLPAP